VTLKQFLFDNHNPVIIDGSGLQPDPELAARNLERAKEVIKRMGARHCLYNPNPPKPAVNEENE
jgi:hypothetical protein